MSIEILARELQQREADGLLRTLKVIEPLDCSRVLVDGKEYINFSSNDYLALGNEQSDSKAAKSSACSSPLVTGRHRIHEVLEQKVLDMVNAPENYSCLLFTSGFAANQAIISALFGRKRNHSILIQDKLNHASLLDAGSKMQALGYCRQYRFRHNDTQHLSQLMQQKIHQDGVSLIATEGVFSMDGDCPNLFEMSELSKQYNAFLLVDDAHAIGVKGKNGAGSLSEQNVEWHHNIIVNIPFGKGMGAQGAAVVAHKTVVDYLTQFSKEYIYSTHISPIQANSLLTNIDRLINATDNRARLQQNISHFKEVMFQTLPEVDLPSNTAIQPVLIGDEVKAVNVAKKLRNYGIWCTAIRYPTVQKGQARLRVTLTAAHNKEQIVKLVETLAASCLEAE
jgi:8-amino-7-oxononanoate synthase